MILSLATLARYAFNIRRLTEDDFFAICATKNITVLYEDVDSSFFMSILGRQIIVINSKLTGVAKEFAQFHELAHVLLHHKAGEPEAYFMGMCDSKTETEADAFAAMALIPQDHLFDTSFQDGSIKAADVYAKRLRLYELYKIAVILVPFVTLLSDFCWFSPQA